MKYIALLLILSVSPLDLIAQERAWRVYSSTDDRFTVEVPPAIRIVKTGERKNEATLGPNERENLDSYAAVYEDASASQEEGNFRVVVIKTPPGLFKSLSRSELVSYLSVLLIGDDDDPKPTRERAINVNGLKGREYVWSRERNIFENGSSSELFRRGRIFDRGNKIYIIVFTGEQSDDLKSPTAEHFLNSLRLHRRKR